MSSAAITLGELAQLLEARLSGAAEDTIIRGASSLSEAGPHDISFLGNPRYTAQVGSSAAAAVLVPLDFNAEQLERGLLHVKDPSAAFMKVVERFAPPPPVWPAGISPLASVSAQAQIGEGVHIAPFVVVEAGAVIGDRSVLLPHVYIGPGVTVGHDCLLYPSVTVRERCQIGHRVIIHSSTVIGSDGFGFIPGRQGHKKIPQVGIVVIENDVELGSNVSVDRARFGKTVVGEGTKVDNLVQIAHNVVIGKHCFIVSQVGIAGSSELGNFVTIAGQSGVAGHVHIGDGSTVMGQSGVSHDLPPKSMVMGSPAIPRKEHIRERFNIRKIEALEQRIAELEKRLQDS